MVISRVGLDIHMCFFGVGFLCGFFPIVNVCTGWNKK